MQERIEVYPLLRPMLGTRPDQIPSHFGLQIASCCYLAEETHLQPCRVGVVEVVRIRRGRKNKGGKLVRNSRTGTGITLNDAGEGSKTRVRPCLNASLMTASAQAAEKPTLKQNQRCTGGRRLSAKVVELCEVPFVPAKSGNKSCWLCFTVRVSLHETFKSASRSRLVYHKTPSQAKLPWR